MRRTMINSKGAKGPLVPILIVVGVIILIGAIALAFLGMLPGFNNPKDLGVRYTDGDLKSLQAKAPYTYAGLPEGTEVSKSLVFSGSVPVKTSFTQEELTARMNTHKWKYNMWEDVQVKINSDGTAETSGRIKKANLEKSMARFGIENQDILDKVKMLPGDPTFYIEGKLSVTNNAVLSDVESLQIGNIEIPKDQIPEGAMQGLAQKIVGGVPGLQINSLTCDDGKLNFDGSIPDTITEVMG
jgi:hypothetical protein